MRKSQLCIAALSLVELTGIACKPSAPSAPEDKVLYDVAQALTSNDRKGVAAYYDLEVRQKLDVWDHSLKNLKSDQQAAALQAQAPRIGDAAALITVGDEAFDELKAQVPAEELAGGKCTAGPVAKEDIGRGVMPKEDEKKMTPEVGTFVFQLRTSVAWLPSFRVNCPSGASFWVEMAQRKKGDAKEAREQPLRLVRVGK